MVHSKIMRSGREGIGALLLAVAMLGGAPLHAASAAAESGLSESAADLTAWQWFYEVPLPTGPAPSPWMDFDLTPTVFDESRADLGDLRLYDGRGREVPFALRVRRTVDEQQAIPAQRFNEQRNDDGSVQVNLDLGDKPPDHEELEVVTSGMDFRRRVQIEGSNDGQKWGTLRDDAWVALYRVDSQTIDLHRVRYAPSRFRYLQVRVEPDRSKPSDRPEISRLAVYHRVSVPGEYVTRPAQLGPREAVRAYGAPGSAWIINLGSDQVPVEKLTFDVTDPDFSRPYFLERIAGEGAFVRIAQGEWRRRAGEAPKPLEIQLPTNKRNEFLGRGEAPKPLEIQLPSEVTSERLRLVVKDFANPPLTIRSAQYTAAARQVVFAREGVTEPVRLYTGNPRAEVPRYDFAENLPAVLTPAPQRVEIGPREPNPDYQPEPKPWTERWPGLVYVVLGVSGAVLLAILVVLARKAMSRDEKQMSKE